jgi:hypothetical protein
MMVLDAAAAACLPRPIMPDESRAARGFVFKVQANIDRTTATGSPFCA